MTNLKFQIFFSNFLLDFTKIKCDKKICCIDYSIVKNFIIKIDRNWKHLIVDIRSSYGNVENATNCILLEIQGLRKFNFRCNNDVEILANTFITWLYLIDADIIFFANFSYILIIFWLGGFTIAFDFSFPRFPKKTRNRVTKIWLLWRAQMIFSRNAMPELGD